MKRTRRTFKKSIKELENLDKELNILNNSLNKDKEIKLKIKNIIKYDDIIVPMGQINTKPLKDHKPVKKSYRKKQRKTKRIQKKSKGPLSTGKLPKAIKIKMPKVKIEKPVPVKRSLFVL